MLWAHMSYSLNPLNGDYIKGSIIWLMKGDARSLDYSTHGYVGSKF